MKRIEEYRKTATIYLVPNLRNGNSLRVEFGGYFDSGDIKRIVEKLRYLGFSCNEAVSHDSLTPDPNILDIVLSLCIDEKKVARDLLIYLEDLLGKDQVINRVSQKTTKIEK